MANASCNVGLSLGFSNFLVLPLPVTVIHLSSLFSPSFDVPAHHHLLPESSFSAYLPKSAINLMRGLKSTSSSLQIDLKWYPLYFLVHMRLSGSTRWDFLRWYFLQWGMCSSLARHPCPSLSSFSRETWTSWLSCSRIRATCAAPQVNRCLSWHRMLIWCSLICCQCSSLI